MDPVDVSRKRYSQVLPRHAPLPLKQEGVKELTTKYGTAYVWKVQQLL